MVYVGGREGLAILHPIMENQMEKKWKIAWKL